MAQNLQNISPDEFIIHPGETITEIIQERDITQKELAIRTGFSAKHISEVINGKKNISALMAKKLEYALEIPASFWRNLQANYDLEVVQFNELHNIEEEEIKIAKEIRTTVETITNETIEPKNGLTVFYLRKKLNLSNLKDIQTLNNAYYRAQFHKNTSENIMYAWQYLCEKKVLSQTNNELDINKLKNSLEDLKNVMHEKKENHLSLIKEILNKSGVLFTTIKNVKNAPVTGLTVKTKKNQIMIVLTFRHKFVDIFWFTLFHEIAHVIYGDYNINQTKWGKNEEIEKRADEFAENILIDKKAYERFIFKNDFSESATKQFAEDNNVLDTIVLGRLMKDGYIDWNKSNLRDRYSYD